MGKVRAVCISEKRGTQKKNVESAVFVEDWGIQGDAHAGKAGFPIVAGDNRGV